MIVCRVCKKEVKVPINSEFICFNCYDKQRRKEARRQKGGQMHVPGRKGEVTLPDGRIVSKQYASQLKNPEAAKLRRKRYESQEYVKARKAVYAKEWRKRNPEYHREWQLKNK